MAQMTIRFANSARAEVNGILAFIALDNPAAAAKFAGKIHKALERLLEFPNSGRLWRGERRRGFSHVAVP